MSTPRVCSIITCCILSLLSMWLLVDMTALSGEDLNIFRSNDQQDKYSEVNVTKSAINFSRDGIRYGFRQILLNVPFTESDKDLGKTFQHLVTQKVKPDNVELVDIAKTVIEPPSQHPYKLHSVPVTPQNKAVMEILHKKKGGFFIECGANDGQISTNTLYLEKELGWHGLLIEMDPFVYTRLLSRSRKAYSINACVSTTRHPVQMEVTSASMGGGRILPNGTYNRVDKIFGERLGEWRPCFPLDTLLIAMDTHHIDYFSLDVEGYELDILRTISWDKVTIDVLSVEYKLIDEGKLACEQFMESKGYVKYDDIHYSDGRNHIHVWDYIFVRKDILERSGLEAKVSPGLTTIKRNNIHF